MRFADSADDNDKLGGGTEKYKTKISINASGTCKWMAPAIFQSTCDVNIEYFPFDEQVKSRSVFFNCQLSNEGISVREKFCWGGAERNFPV